MKSMMSATVTEPDWLKSAAQHGVCAFPGTLQALPAPANLVFGPVQAKLTRT
jgi:hypothetical protein